MTILDTIESKISEITNDKYSMLWIASKNVVSDTNNHNKNIHSQMSSYDIHDEEHSKKILEIEELLLGEKISDLSFSELLLLYLSAYLHDSAMALPNWEYIALKSIEGTENCYDNTVKFAIRNDLKSIQKYCEVRDIVCKNKGKLFDYSQAKDYIFAPITEDEMIDEISLLIVNYQEFRSGYYDALKEKVDNVEEYLDYSQKIRIEFIRQTHHVRVEKNVKRLIEKFKDSIGECQAQKFVDILAKVCRAHGENLEYVKNLSSEFMVFNKEKCNVQFVAMMLRLGDVVHFDNERAPISLFAERQISDPISKIHWKSKEQELEYEINSEGENITLKYYAYCKTPETYYFIQNYMDWIDVEISNYYHLKNWWQSQRIEKYECYDLPLSMVVDRSGLEYDVEVFRPDRTLKFVLNQNKILEMLAGVQLYQDRLLCLRELYQNALDASKCMRANNMTEGIRQKLPIVFGLGQELVEGREQKYIYCLDHGIGMDDYIIKNYLLKIGTSYYKSADFMKANANWNFEVNPTSQFGIGLLSGYMLADKIGITSVYYKSQRAISCIISNKEQSYYNNPRKGDIEKIGNHGTLIKLYLKKEYEDVYNNQVIEKFPLLLMSSNHNIWKEYVEESVIKNNLQYIIFKYIGIVEDDIPVQIEDDKGLCEEVLSSVTVFDNRNYPDITKEDVEKLWSEYHYLDGTYNPYKEVLNNRQNIIDYSIEIRTENIELYSHIALPHKGIEYLDVKLFDYCHFLGNREGSFYVDGVYVDKVNEFSDYSYILGRDLVRHSIINFVGKQRPDLSVDRKTILAFPKIEDEVELLRKQFISKVIEIVNLHISRENYEMTDSQISLIFDILVRKFSSIANELMNNLAHSEINIDLFVDDALKKSNVRCCDLFQNSNVRIDDADFRNYREITRQIIVGRLLGADKIEIDGDSITISGDAKIVEFPFANLVYHSHYSEISLFSSIIRADKWDGEYSEYDMVNTIWPIVSPDLYLRLNDYDTKEVLNRVKTVGEYGNSVAGMANLDPVLIDPDIGISSKNHDILVRNRCYVGVIEKIENQFFLLEFTKHGSTYFEKKEAYVLYAFYNPRKLNELELERLEELSSKKKEYCKGVKEGFSVLYLGGNKPNYIIRAGKFSKSEILKAVPDSFWEEGITYFDMKRNIVHQGKN